MSGWCRFGEFSKAGSPIVLYCVAPSWTSRRFFWPIPGGALEVEVCEEHHGVLTEKLKRCEIVIRIDIERVAREHPDSPEPVGEVETALNLIVQYGGFAEDNHGQWVIDQVARILASEQYDEMVRRACADGSEWELGIAP